MIKYLMYQKNPASHYVYIDMFIDSISQDIIQLQLPAWRPGRYELGNFAKNVKRVDVFNEKNEALPYIKLNKDLWQIDTKNQSSLKVTYSYYAAELNAGACYADTNQLYINPIHCCMYVVDRMNEEHQVELTIPEDYKIVCSLPRIKNRLTAKNFDELVDSPFVASEKIQSDFYEVNAIKFYLHFIGECKPDFKKIKNDFFAFTKKSIEFWNDFTTDQYHFIFQVLPFKFYHGVEHIKNTVIAIGPGYAINSGSVYEDVLGVSCHELFHSWNVKTIRPIEMLPYNYTKENYAKTGYVYEGFTTYYGDKLLLSSNVFSQQQYFETLQERLTKHFHNYGRYNLSVADSSLETWLDGYVPGAPYRKTNIYDEGSLIAFMLDVKILQSTQNKKSLRDVCVLLYQRFGKKGIGYSENSIIELVNEVSGKDFTEFFKTFVYSPQDFELELKTCFDYLGIEFEKKESEFVCENRYGFKIMDSGLNSKVTLVAPYSPAWKGGLFTGDEIIAVNGIALKNNFNNWLSYFDDAEEIILTVNSAEQLKTIPLRKDKKGTTYFFNPKLKLSNNEEKGINTNLKAWIG
ncbi:MAG: PDZ domain-containing protein [Bacteroidota bacterium]|nr:PDZ domain-containing protein [Bacteroidota bacterium]